MLNDDKDPAAVALGRRGGKAGTGKSKVRGGPEYYREISQIGVQKRKEKAREKARLKRAKAKRD